MLTRENVAANDDIGQDRFKETNEFEDSFRDQMRERALKIYKNELNRPTSIDLGLHGVTRATLRTLCKTAVLESSKMMKRRYSYSALSSSIHSLIQDNNAISALRALQKERLVVSRLGFADRAMEIDKEIEIMREKAKKARKEEEDKILDQRMRNLTVSQNRKEQRLEYILAEETRQMETRFKKEEGKLLKRQEIEFLRVLENATRRAIGRVKKCNCATPYTCRHNKTASYNTRRPTHTVVTYRRNAKRLKAAGRPEEASAWEEKAKEIDEREQEQWRARVADSIVSSPWGANEAAVDQITEMHKKELAVLHKTHDVKRDMHEKKQAMRRKNFRNTMLAEARKVKMQCRKQALLRIRKDFVKEQKEMQRQQSLAGHSDGLKNVSRNLLGEEFDMEEKKAVDWVAPTTFGLVNSVRLVDAVKEINPSALTTIDGGVEGRILTSKQDMKSLTPEQLRQKIHSVLKNDNSDSDSESSVDGGDKDEDGGAVEDEDFTYKLGVTSGSKLVDKMRNKSKDHKSKEEKANVAASPGPSLASQSTALGGWNTAGASSSNGFPQPNFMNNAGGAGGFGTGFNPPSGFGSPMPFMSQPMSPFGTPAYNSGNNSNGNDAAGFGTNSNTNPFMSSSFPNPFATTTAAFGSTAAPTNPPSNFGGSLSVAPNTNVVPVNKAPSAPVAPVAPNSPAPSAPSFRAGLHVTPSKSMPQLESNVPTPQQPTQMQQSQSASNTAMANKAIPFPSFGNNNHGMAAFQPPQLQISKPHEQVGFKSTEERAPGIEPTRSHSFEIDPDDISHHNDSEDNENEGGSPPSTPRNSNNSKSNEPPKIIPPQIQWKFDPIEDTKPIPFKPGSLKDEDWRKQDEELGKGNGVENSYGIPILVDEFEVYSNKNGGGSILMKNKSTHVEAHSHPQTHTHTHTHTEVNKPVDNVAMSSNFGGGFNGGSNPFGQNDSTNPFGASSNAFNGFPNPNSSFPVSSAPAPSSSSSMPFFQPSNNTLQFTPSFASAAPAFNNPFQTANSNAFPASNLNSSMENATAATSASVSHFDSNVSMAARNNIPGQNFMNDHPVEVSTKNSAFSNPSMNFSLNTNNNNAATISSMSATSTLQETSSNNNAMMGGSQAWQFSSNGFNPPESLSLANVGKLPSSAPNSAAPSIIAESGISEPSSPMIEHDSRGHAYRPYTPLAFEPHQPPTIGSPDSIPLKSALLQKSNYNAKLNKKKVVSMLPPTPTVANSAKKSVQFGKNVVVEVESFAYTAEDFSAHPVTASTPVAAAAAPAQPSGKNKPKISVANSPAPASALMMSPMMKSSGTVGEDEEEEEIPLNERDSPLVKAASLDMEEELYNQRSQNNHGSSKRDEIDLLSEASFVLDNNSGTPVANITPFATNSTVAWGAPPSFNPNMNQTMNQFAAMSFQPQDSVAQQSTAPMLQPHMPTESKPSNRPPPRKAAFHEAQEDDKTSEKSFTSNFSNPAGNNSFVTNNSFSPNFSSSFAKAPSSVSSNDSNHAGISSAPLPVNNSSPAPWINNSTTQATTGFPTPSMPSNSFGAFSGNSATFMSTFPNSSSSFPSSNNAMSMVPSTVEKQVHVNINLPSSQEELEENNDMVNFAVESPRLNPPLRSTSPALSIPLEDGENDQEEVEQDPPLQEQSKPLDQTPIKQNQGFPMSDSPFAYFDNSNPATPMFPSNATTATNNPAVASVSASAPPMNNFSSGFGGFAQPSFPMSSSFPSNNNTNAPSTPFGGSNSFGGPPSSAIPIQSASNGMNGIAGSAFMSASLPVASNPFNSNMNSSTPAFGAPDMSGFAMNYAANLANNELNPRIRNPAAMQTPDYVDLSIEQGDNRSVSTDENNSRHLHNGFAWELCFSRLVQLSNLEETLDFLLLDDELFESAELFVSTTTSLSAANAHHGSGSGNNNEPESHDESMISATNETILKQLPLLREWKKFQKKRSDFDTEALLIAMEDCFQLEIEEIEDLPPVIRQHETQFQTVFHDIAMQFLPHFLLSSDYATYLESHTIVKSHNKRLTIDSKSWLGKFQKAMASHSFGIHLFVFNASNSRPYANQKMRDTFGPMCDAPSPQEYILPNQSPPGVVEDFLHCMKHGMDYIAEGVMLRTLKSKQPLRSTLAVKHLYGAKRPDTIKYSLVIFQDMSTPNAKDHMNVLHFLLDALPHITGSVAGSESVVSSPMRY